MHVKNAATFFRFILILSFFFLYSCAIQVPPTGGEKDVIAPVLKESSPKNYSTEFTGNTIRLVFDEYVSLKDITEQLIISPLQKNQPEIKVRKRVVFITLKDTLLPNTTYTMNFGNSITDINEANALPDFQFVFSTGDHIDSLKITGTAIHAFDLKADKADRVFLYKSSSDSIVFKSKPDYFTKVAENGSWTVSNITKGDYTVIAIKDEDGSFTYSPGELIGFYDKRVEAGSDSIKLRMFKEPLVKGIYKAVADGPGKINIFSNNPINLNDIKWLSDTVSLKIQSTVFNSYKDSLTFYYTNLLSDSITFVSSKDTFNVRLTKAGSEVKMKRPFSLSAIPTGSTQNINEPLQIVFNHPLVTIDTTKIIFNQDSLPVSYTYSFSGKDQNALSLNAKWKEKANYKVKILPGALTDIYSLKNDTLLFGVTTKAEKDYGSLTVKLQSKSSNLILQLVDEKDIVYRQIKAGPLNEFTFLEPRLYKLKIIDDNDADGRWSTGKLIEKVQPEQVFYYPEQITVRANWDVDVNWKIE